MAIPKIARDALHKQEHEIRSLTDRAVNAETKLEQLKDNEKLVSFVEKVAESQSKFAAEARELLDL